LENEIIYVYDGLALHPDDFYQKEHRDIYAAMQSLWHARKTIDVVTLGDQLAKDGVLDAM
jgi:replicative DNA helicase